MAKMLEEARALLDERTDPAYREIWDLKIGEWRRRLDEGPKP